MEYVNLDKTKSYKALLEGKKSTVKELLTPERVKSHDIALGGGLRYNWAAMPLSDDTVSGLQALSDEMDLIGKYKEILSGVMMNTGEKRLVLHHLTRGNVLGKKIEADGEDKDEFYKEELKKIKEFSDDVREGRITGSTGKKFTTVCQIGIGGSDLGPRALYLALKGWADGKGIKQLRGEFISNVDPDDAAAVIKRLDFETTLFAKSMSLISSSVFPIE